MFIAISIFTTMAIQPLTPDNSVPSCVEDAQASSLAYHLADLPPEVRDDVLRATRGRIGERPRPLRQGDVITPENSNHLTIRYYRALLIRDTWYVQIEHTSITGVHTLGYARGANGAFQRVMGVHFAGPACETIRAALAGVNSSVWYLTN